MRLALGVADLALAAGDVPIGAVVLDQAGCVIGEGFNLGEADGIHSTREVLVLVAAARSTGRPVAAVGLHLV